MKLYAVAPLSFTDEHIKDDIYWGYGLVHIMETSLYLDKEIAQKDKDSTSNSKLVVISLSIETLDDTPYT